MKVLTEVSRRSHCVEIVPKGNAVVSHRRVCEESSEEEICPFKKTTEHQRLKLNPQI